MLNKTFYKTFFGTSKGSHFFHPNLPKFGALRVHFSAAESHPGVGQHRKPPTDQDRFPRSHGVFDLLRGTRTRTNNWNPLGCLLVMVLMIVWWFFDVFWSFVDGFWWLLLMFLLMPWWGWCLQFSWANGNSSSFSKTWLWDLYSPDAGTSKSSRFSEPSASEYNYVLAW